MATSFTESIKDLPSERKKDLKRLRKILKDNKPREISEAFEDDQLIYRLPLKYYPDAYTKRPLMYAALTNRKSYISLNLISIFNDKVYRHKFADKILKTGVCSGASGCCYKIKSVNDDLEKLLEKELKKMTTKKFISIFKKYREK